MSNIALPVELVARFRGTALARLERVEAGWSALLRGDTAPELAAEIQQEMHTLKGEARMMRFTGLATLCHAVEGLLQAAACRGYVVPEDVDVVATMAIRFMIVLLRRKDEAPSGMDVDGFVTQIEEILVELTASTPSVMVPPKHTQRPSIVVEMPDRVSTGTQQRLAALATRIFVEHVAAGRGRGRLGDVFRGLVEEVRAITSIALAPRLARHEEATLALAESLGKRVKLVLDAGDMRVRAEAAEAVEVMLLHALRNAVDHGIEPLAVRREKGKPEVAQIVVASRLVSGVSGLAGSSGSGSMIEIVVEDDGVGVDLDKVRARAVELEFLTPSQLAASSEADLLELLFRSGMSTRREITDISGRGIGLDAARAAVMRAGGRVSISTNPGRGTRIAVLLPQPNRTMPVACFPARGADFVFAVGAGAGVRIEPSEGGMPALDPVEVFDMAPPFGARSGEGARFEVSRGDTRYTLRAGGVPWLGVANRICPTAEDCPAEVVLVDGEEVLLLRPELLGA